MAGASTSESEIKSWLKSILKKDNSTNLSVKILGTSEKGDGYLGDIVFVQATENTEDKSTKEYNLVLKCSKRSQVLREKSGVSNIFQNEIFFFEELLPSFTQFQKDNGVAKPFNSVPKCYGAFVGENMEVIALEDMKKRGFELWPKKYPLTRKHIDLVITEYAKFHATSIAMKEHQPDKFQKFVDTLEKSRKKLSNSFNMNSVFESCIDEVYEILKNDLEEDILLTWRDFKKQVKIIFSENPDQTALKVVRHGDCWNNNFMYKCENADANNPTEVVILDWQMTSYTPLVNDLSYFLFTCISKEDIQHLDDILKTYYKSFTDQLRELGTQEPEELYSFKQFLTEWKKYCKYGVLLTTLVLKMCSTEKDEVVDVGDNAESGKDFNHAFETEIRDKDNFRNRMWHIVEYAVKHELI